MFRASIARPIRSITDDDIGDEEGENIIDEEAELQNNTLSYIECKPSINQSNNKRPETQALLPKSQKPNSMSQTMHNSMSSKNMGGGLKALNKGINSRSRTGNKGGGLFEDRYL